MSTLTDLCAEREHWSYSSLHQFLNVCTLQWAFQRWYQLPPEFVPAHLSFGSAFHRTLEAINLQRLEGKRLGVKEAQELFSDLWGRQQQQDVNIRYEEDCGAEKLAEQGRALVACYAGHSDSSEEILSVNLPFCVPLVGEDGSVLEKPLAGELDLLTRQNGLRIVVDWKTSSTRWPPAKCHRALQPTVYLYGYQMQYGEQPAVEFRYDIIVKNKTPILEQHRTRRSKDSFHRLVEKVKLVESMIAAEHFFPNEEGMFCKSCPYQGACKTWHKERSRLISLPPSVPV